MKKGIILLLLTLSFGVFGQVTIGTQDFETSPATPTLSFVASGTGGGFQTGTTTASERPASANKFFDGSKAYGVINGDHTITFGPINAAGYTNTKFSFRLASYSINSGANGADGGDLVEVSISQDGTTYSKELSIAGNTNACWNFSATGVATTVYDGNNAATAVAAPGGGLITTGFGNPSITGLPTASTLYIKVRFLNNSANELWLIDQAALEGTVNSSPIITVNPTSISGLTYLENNGPSSGVSYSLSGINLIPVADNITVTAPTNFEVSTTLNGTYTDNLPVAYTNGALSSTPIFVRLKTGLSVGNYGGVGISVTNTGGGATTANVAVSGSVTNGLACGNTTDIATVRATIPAQQTYSGSAGTTITGSITGIFGANKFYVQDATGGIAVFFTNVVTTNGLVLGDVVRLTGTTARFNGESEIITLTCISKVSSGTVPVPTVFDSNNPPNNIALNDFLSNNEGELIKIVSANIQSVGTFAASTNYTVITCNNQGGTEIRIDPTATNLIGTNIPTVTQDIIGLVGHFINATGTDKLQLFPSLTTDLANSTTTCSVSGGCGITTFIEDPNKLDIFNWNIEWLGHPTNGPSQSGVGDITQITNATNIIKNVNADVYMLQEICQYNSSNPSDITTAFGTILKGLNDTHGANTFSGECSSAYSTSIVDANPQRVCFIYKNSVVTKIYAKPMFENFTPATYPPTGTPSQFWASGRKPFKFMAKVSINNQIDTVLFVGLHAKSGSDLTSYGRRKYDVKAMYDTLQAEFPTRKTIVLGDLNDDMDKSIAIGQISSYVPFLYTNPDETVIAGTRPSAFWNPISKALSDANCASTASFPDYIDHQIISNEFYDSGVTGIKYSLASVSSFRPVLANYSTTTSDHYPTVSRFEFGTICPQTLTLIDPTDSYSSGVQVKQASAANGKIIATNHITGTSNTTFQAKSIELNAGFKADNGTVFKAEIGGCN